MWQWSFTVGWKRQGSRCRLVGALITALAVPCLAASDERPASTHAPEYRVLGIVVNSRDGAPVAHCRLSVVRVGAALNAQEQTRAVERSERPGEAAAGELTGADRPDGERRPRITGGPALLPALRPATAETDARGHFSLVLPGAGMWRLTGEARGFRAQALDEHDGFSSAVVVTSSHPAEMVRFRLVANSIIEGVVLDEAGEPVRQAQVGVHRVVAASAEDRFQRMQQSGFAQTDDRGHYELDGLTPGVYKLSVAARPWYAMASPAAGAAGTANPANAAARLDASLDVVYPATWYPGDTDAERAGSITLRSGEDIEADFHLLAVPAVHLRVPGALLAGPAGDGRRPAQGPMPQVLSAQGGAAGFGFGGYGQVNSYGDNTWDIGGLAPGSYQVRLPNADGRGDRLVQVTLGAGAPQTLAADAASTGTTVTVAIEGAAAADVRQVAFVDPVTGQSFYTDNNQRFRMRRSAPARGGTAPGSQEATVEPEAEAAAPRTVSLPPGRYVVYLTAAQGVYLSGVRATGAAATGRSVTIGGGTPVVTVVAGRGLGEVTGFVTGSEKTSANPGTEQGTERAGAMVLLIPATFGQSGSIDFVARDQSNTDGSFVLANVFPGQYILVAIDHGWDVNWRDPATLAQYLGHGTPLTITAGEKLRKDIAGVAP